MTKPPRLIPETARAHLLALDPSTDNHNWLLTDDTGLGRMARALNGTFDQVSRQLERGQSDGFAVHVTVNRMVGRRRRVSEVNLVRAVWLELDGPLTVPLPIPASLLINTSEGKGHVYWLTNHDDPPTTAEARRICRLAAARHGGDLNACDLARVLRLAGSVHQKGQPHRVEIVGGTDRRYTRSELLVAFPDFPSRAVVRTEIKLADRYITAALRGIVSDLSLALEGNRNATLNRLAFRCGQLGLEPRQVASILTPTAIMLGLPPQEIANTIRRGATAGGGEEGGDCSWISMRRSLYHPLSELPRPRIAALLNVLLAQPTP